MSSKFNIEMVLAATRGEILSNVKDGFTAVGTDTREDLSGQIFIALKGANFNAHEYLDKAVEQGADLLIVDQLPEKFAHLKEKVSIVKVKETLLALQLFAYYWRRQLNGKVVGITGSNGKTTTKEFAATLLKTKFKTFANPGSFNNHWGVPLSILKVDKDADWAIVELGMNKKGEITHLCQIAAPDVVIVTMVGSAHIGGLGSQQAIAEAKGEIYDSCPQATQIFNKDNEHTIFMYADAQRRLPQDVKERIKTFSSFDKDSDVSLRVESMNLDSIVLSGHINKVSNKITIPVFGRHNINNVMAACCIALACGMTAEEIWAALPDCKGIWGRNQVFELKSGAKVLFDAYNASLESTSALIKNLFEFDLSGKRMAVIGQMLELGKDSSDIHEKVGELVAQTGFESVWFIGPDKSAFERGMKRGGFEKNLFLSDTYEESLAIQLGSMLNQQDVAIIKGSRGMKLEKVLETWQAQQF